jgi:hypothetical protein
MKQVLSASEVNPDHYYMVYSDRFSHKLDKHIIVFDHATQEYLTLVSAKEHGYGKLKLYHTISRMDSLANYNIYGGVFELTEQEVLRHIVMENI